MSIVYKGAIPATYFTSISKQWRGTGVVVHILPGDVDENVNAMLADLNAKICKIKLGLPGLVFTDSRLEDASMTALWQESDLAKSGAVQDAFASVNAHGYATVIISVQVPRTWLVAETVSLSGESLLTAYVRYIVGCVTWIQSFGNSSKLRYIEVFEEPDRAEARVSPQDLVFLATRLRTALAMQKVGVIGPGLSQAAAAHDNSDAYTNAFVNGTRSLSLFTVHAEPPLGSINNTVADEDNGTDAQGDVLYRCLQRNVASFSSITWEKERWVTSFGARLAMKANSDYVIVASRALCAIIKAGFSTACFHRLKDDVIGLYRSDGLSTLWRDWFAILGSRLPVDGSLYASEEMAAGDDTFKAMVLSSRGDRFTIILCRPETTDLLRGSLRLIVRNPLWSDQYRVTAVTYDTYPVADTTGVTYKSNISSGAATLTFSNLPYASHVILISGTVSLNPPLDPPPPTGGDGDGDVDGDGTGGTTVSLLETILQVPVHFGTPRISTAPTVGTFYYDTKEQKAKVFIGSEWTEAHMLSRGG